MPRIAPLNTPSSPGRGEAAEGTRVSPGIVAALARNIARYNAGQRAEAERELAQAVPILVRTGLFEVFPAEEWISGNNPGRRFVGFKAKDLLYKLARQKAPRD